MSGNLTFSLLSVIKFVPDVRDLSNKYLTRGRKGLKNAGTGLFVEGRALLVFCSSQFKGSQAPFFGPYIKVLEPRAGFVLGHFLRAGMSCLEKISL